MTPERASAFRNALQHTLKRLKETLMSALVGAVQEVVSAVVSENVPLVAVHAWVKVSPALGSCTEAVRESEEPV